MSLAVETSPWLVAAAILLLAWIPCAITVFRGDLADRLVALEMAGAIQSCLLILLAEAFHRPAFMDLALAVSLLAFGGGMVFARFLERWL